MGALLTLALLAAADGPPVLVVTEGLNADLVSTACGRHEAPSPALLKVAGQLRAWPDALRVDVGNVVGASALGDLITRHDSTGFAQALHLLGLQAIVLGRRDLATTRAPLLATAKSLKAAKLPFIASNLRCDSGAKQLCLETVISSTVETPNGRVAFVSALAPGVLDNVALDRRQGLTLADPVTSLKEVIALVRSEGARWVVAIYEGAAGHELNDSLAVADQLGALATGERPDLLLTLHLASQLGSVQTATASALTMVAPVSGHVTQVWPVRRDAAEPPPPLDADDPLVRWSSSTEQWLCETFAGDSHGWVLKEPVVFADQLTDLMLDALRERTHAEVALLNRGSIRAPAQLRSRLTELDVATMLPFDNAVVRVEVPGSTLKRLITTESFSKELFMRGASRTETAEVLINGRPLDETQSYSVVTNEYVAAGGDGVLTDKHLRFERVLGTSVRQIWVDQLNRRATVKQQADLPIADPAKRTRWLFRATSDLSFSFVRVVNPEVGVYTDSQLSRSSAVAFRGDIELRGDADHPSYTWENGLRLRYGLSRTALNDGTDSTALTETDDLMYLRDTVTVRRSAKSVLVPFAESYLESELTAPTTRSFQHLEWRPIGGARLQLLPELSLFAGAGLDWETLAKPGDRGVAEPIAAAAVVGGAALRPRALFSLGQLPVTAEGSLDVSWRDPAKTSSALVRLHAKLSIPVFQALALTIAYDLFARHAGTMVTNSGWGFAQDLVIGLGFRWAQPVQGFAF